MEPQTEEAGHQDEVIAFLSRGETFGQADQDVQRIETHAAIIFLIGDRAYKLKRAVRYSFLDFSTLAKRRTALEAEYKLNVRTAPELYRGVFAVTRDGAGNLTLGGDGEPVDWLLEMRRFDQHCLLDHLAEKGKLEGRLMVSLAMVVADLHRIADVRSTGGFDAMSRVVDGNANDLEILQGILGRSHDVVGLIEATRGQLAQHHDLLDRRTRRGFVRRCHGDLHLGNIFVEDGHPVLFDCLEFDEDLASIDVFYDLAFLLMDLCHRDLQALAIDLFNAYVDRTHDDEGCALLPLFLAIRATIRAKIEGFEIETAASPEGRRMHVVEAVRYLDLADTLLAVQPPCLIAIGGFSGSGKSTVARLLASRLGMQHWAVLLRSDVIRKHLADVSPTERLRAEAYRRDRASEAYRTLEQRARTLLQAGRTVIADATFLNPDDRIRLEQVANDLALPFYGFWLEASPQVLADRVAARRDDASDATVDVLKRQLARNIDTMTWNAVDACGKAERIAEQVQRRLPC